MRKVGQPTYDSSLAQNFRTLFAYWSVWQSSYNINTNLSRLQNTSNSNSKETTLDIQYKVQVVAYLRMNLARNTLGKAKFPLIYPEPHFGLRVKVDKSRKQIVAPVPLL